MNIFLIIRFVTIGIFPLCTINVCTKFKFILSNLSSFARLSLNSCFSARSANSKTQADQL